MNKLKILWVEHHGALGGATLLLLQLLKVLDRRIYQPLVAAPLFSSPFFLDSLRVLEIPYFLLPIFTWSKRSRMTFKSRVASSLRSSWQSGGYVRTVRKLKEIIRREGIDLVHTNSATVIDGALAARLTGVPHVWHIREHLGDSPITKFWVGNKGAIRIMYQLSDRIIVMSNFVKTPFELLGLSEKIKVVYEYIRPEILDNKNSFDLKAFLGLGTDSLLVGMVANGTSWKRHIDLIKVAERICPVFSQTYFVLIGHFPKSRYRKLLEGQIQKGNLKNQVFLAGEFPRELNFFQGMDVLLHPTVNEPFGMAVIEGMAAGLPVVATRSGGPNESVVDGETGFRVSPYDVDGMAASLKVLLESKDLRRKIGQAGRRRALTMFGDPRRFSNEINQIYESVLKTTPRKSLVMEQFQYD